jgi:hypothetical protein
MFLKSFYFLLIIIVLQACNAKQKFEPQENGAPFHYLLNTTIFAQHQLYDLGTGNLNFIEIDESNAKNDSSFLTATQVDWKQYIDALMSINVQDSAYNKVYSMSQEMDTVIKNITINFDALYTNLPVQKLYLTLSAGDNKVQIIYAESKNVSMFKTIEQKLTYVTDKTFQLQSTIKPLVGNSTTTIKKLIFVPKITEPSVQIF